MSFLPHRYHMLNQLHRIGATELKSPPSVPAPRVKIRLTDAGPSIEPAFDETANQSTFVLGFFQHSGQ